MKYFIINTTYKDGDYEYLCQSPYAAEHLKAAIELAEYAAKDWTQHDYREYEIELRAEVTKEEFEVLNKYIY